MEDGSKKLGLVLGTIAAVAGIAIASYMVLSHFQKEEEESKATMSLPEVLAEAQVKIREIQQQLADLHPGPLQSPSGA